MPNLKPMEILLIVLVVLLLFGAKRLPDLAKSVGKSLKILKNEVKDLNDDRPDGDAGVTPPTVTNATRAPSEAPPVAPTAPSWDPVKHAQAADDTERKQV